MSFDIETIYTRSEKDIFDESVESNYIRNIRAYVTYIETMLSLSECISIKMQ